MKIEEAEYNGNSLLPFSLIVLLSFQINPQLSSSLLLLIFYFYLFIDFTCTWTIQWWIIDRVKRRKAISRFSCHWLTLHFRVVFVCFDLSWFFRHVFDSSYMTIEFNALQVYQNVIAKVSPSPTIIFSLQSQTNLWSFKFFTLALK